MKKTQNLHHIEQTIKTIDEVINLDHDSEVINRAERDKMHSVRERMDNLRRKLDTGELEVAVVGLEKSGKSTFSSAFVGVDGLFPSEDERCTFTSTKLQYGTENHAIVKFYSQQKFIENLKSMLKDVKYPNSNIPTIEQFDKHFNELETTDNSTYLKHSSRTQTDIKDIIYGLSDIRKLLDKEDKKFDDFNNEELKKYITDKYSARAVRSVTFFLTDLNRLKNIILYDVPGFDSPTQVHLTQTINKLKDVDAIIMIKSIKKPSLIGSEVDILVKNNDMDGIRLHEKLFVFGSYADMVDNSEALDKNKKTLIDELSKSLKNTFDRKRLFTGCLNKKREPQLEEIGSKTELSELKDALEDYNQNARAVVLEKRTNKAIEEIKEIFENIIKRNNSEISNVKNDESRIILSLYNESCKELENKLSSFINTQKNSIVENKKFTNFINEKINSIMPQIEDDDLTDGITEIKSSDTRNFPNYEELNTRVRKKTTQEIKGNFIELLVGISKTTTTDIEDGTVDVFLKALDIGQEHPKYEVLKQNIKNYIHENTKDRQFNTDSFKAIVDRFTIDLIDTMITYPLASNARENRFLEGKRELYATSFFSQNGITHPAYKSDLVSLVLTQKIRNDENRDEDIKKKKVYIDEIKQEIKNKNQDSDNEIISCVAKSLTNKAIAKSIPIFDILNIIVGSDNNDVIDIYDLVDNYMDNQNSGSDDDSIYLKTILNGIKSAQSQEEVKAEIEKDMENLEYLLKDSAFEAISLELPFNSAITYFIDTLKKSVKEEVFIDFIATHIRDIKHYEFIALDEEKRKSETKLKIINKMTTIVKKIS